MKTNVNNLRVDRQPDYPAKRPDARIAGAVMSSAIYQKAILKLQKPEIENGVTHFRIYKNDVRKLAKSARGGEAKLAVNNMLRYFKAKKLQVAERDELVNFINQEARTELSAAAGKDGKITGKESKKLSKYLKEDFDYVTQGTLPNEEKKDLTAISSFIAALPNAF